MTPANIEPTIENKLMSKLLLLKCWLRNHFRVSHIAFCSSKLCGKSFKLCKYFYLRRTLVTDTYNIFLTPD